MNKLRGVALAVCVFSSSAGFAEPGRIVDVVADNYIWGYTGTIITFDPDSGAPNYECNLYGSNTNVGNSVVGTMALVAMKYDSVLDSVDMTCGNTGAGYNVELSIYDNGNQVLSNYTDTESFAFSSINGVHCFTSTAGQGDKILLAMANNWPITTTCVWNPYAKENTLNIVF